VSTWAGDFLLDRYDVEQGESDTTVNGVEIRMRFHPNTLVDAEQIAFVQTVSSAIDGKPVNVFVNKYGAESKEAKVAESRTIPASQRGAGTHIDQMPLDRTPLAGMKYQSSDELSKADPNPTLTEIGCHFTDSTGTLHEHDAMLHDDPSLGVRADQSASQTFETAALAIAGTQTGLFYGSVAWGWSMKAGDSQATRKDFKLASSDAPSSIFQAAADRWNASKTTEDTPSIHVPGTTAWQAAARTELWEGPGTGKKTVLPGRARVELTDKREEIFGPSYWRNVVVISGPLAGKSGWVAAAKLTPLAR
jgi:hypothetical protein